MRSILLLLNQLQLRAVSKAAKVPSAQIHYVAVSPGGPTGQGVWAGQLWDCSCV